MIFFKIFIIYCYKITLGVIFHQKIHHKLRKNANVCNYGSCQFRKSEFFLFHFFKKFMKYLTISQKIFPNDFLKYFFFGSLSFLGLNFIFQRYKMCLVTERSRVRSLCVCSLKFLKNKWRSPSLSELTPIIIYM